MEQERFTDPRVGHENEDGAGTPPQQQHVAADADSWEGYESPSHFSPEGAEPQKDADYARPTNPRVNFS